MRTIIFYAAFLYEITLSDFCPSPIQLPSPTAMKNNFGFGDWPANQNKLSLTNCLNCSKKSFLNCSTNCLSCLSFYCPKCLTSCLNFPKMTPMKLMMNLTMNLTKMTLMKMMCLALICHFLLSNVCFPPQAE